MKGNLMFRNRDFNLKEEPCFGKDILIEDLQLKRMLHVMAQGDETVYAACNTALFCSLKSVEEILYRQENLRDALRNPDAVRRLYEITVETEKKRKDSWHWLSSAYLSSTLSSAVELMKIYIGMLMKLRRVADNNLPDFRSEGFRNLLTGFQQELNDDYLAEAHAHLNDLQDGDGILISAVPGNDLQGIHYVLRRKNRKGFWWRWRFAPSYTIAHRDDAGATDLERRCGCAANEATNALAQAAEHLEHFFATLRGELAFYVGCLNLANALGRLGMPIAFPKLLSINSKNRSWVGLYDVSLALVKDAPVVGNDLEAADKQLYLITGANQGGKTTFLRSIGQAQLMAQCGMFVGAKGFTAPIRNLVLSHFKKEEDVTLQSGKLEEELIRMSDAADHLEKNALMLFNESFAATNEREGSEISKQITKALVENGVEVFSVTHLYSYAAAFLCSSQTQFLRAQRLDNGERTFRMISGEPLKTAFGEDLYRKIFE